MHEILIGSKLNSLLFNRVNIGPPNTGIITKMGDMYQYEIKNQRYIAGPALNFYLCSLSDKKWNVGEGPAISSFEDDYILKFNEAIQKFADKIIEFAGNDIIKFNIMVMPRYGIESSNLELMDNILIRYIKSYMPATDNLATRWDVMVTKEPKDVT